MRAIPCALCRTPWAASRLLLTISRISFWLIIIIIRVVRGHGPARPVVSARRAMPHKNRQTVT